MSFKTKTPEYERVETTKNHAASSSCTSGVSTSVSIAERADDHVFGVLVEGEERRHVIWKKIY